MWPYIFKVSEPWCVSEQVRSSFSENFMISTLMARFEGRFLWLFFALQGLLFSRWMEFPLAVQAASVPSFLLGMHRLGQELFVVVLVAIQVSLPPCEHPWRELSLCMPLEKTRHPKKKNLNIHLNTPSHTRESQGAHKAPTRRSQGKMDHQLYLYIVYSLILLNFTWFYP